MESSLQLLPMYINRPLSTSPSSLTDFPQTLEPVPPHDLLSHTHPSSLSSSSALFSHHPPFSPPSPPHPPTMCQYSTYVTLAVCADIQRTDDPSACKRQTILAAARVTAPVKPVGSSALDRHLAIICGAIDERRAEKEPVVAAAAAPLGDTDGVDESGRIPSRKGPRALRRFRELAKGVVGRISTFFTHYTSIHYFTLTFLSSAPSASLTSLPRDSNAPSKPPISHSAPRSPHPPSASSRKQTTRRPSCTDTSSGPASRSWAQPDPLRARTPARRRSAQRRLRRGSVLGVGRGRFGMVFLLFPPRPICSFFFVGKG